MLLQVGGEACAFSLQACWLTIQLRESAVDGYVQLETHFLKREHGLGDVVAF